MASNREEMKDAVSDDLLETFFCSFVAPNGCIDFDCPLKEACFSDDTGAFHRAFKKWLDKEA